MITEKINDNEYEVQVYDWVDSHDDYVCGYIKRNPECDCNNDLLYWRLYPAENIRPINAGDLRSIYNFMAKLNDELE